LPEELRAYASQDTIFLPDLCHWLTEGLEKLGRLHWHSQACQALIKATAKIKEVDEDDEPWRVHGSAKLYPRQLAALKAIWTLREQEADSRDLPSFKICPTELLIRLALAIPPEGRPELWPNLPSRWADDFRQRLVDALEAVLIQAPAAWPARKSGPKRVLKHPDPDLLQKLRDIRDEKAKELALDPSLIATRATMTAAALTGCVKAEAVRASVNWMPWQEELLLPLWLKVGETGNAT
jgi:ribonuclease D